MDDASGRRFLVRGKSLHHEGDKIGLFLFGEIETATHFFRKIRVGNSASIVELDDFLEGLDTAVVHVGSRLGDVSHRRDFEVPFVAF